MEKRNWGGWGKIEQENFVSATMAIVWGGSPPNLQRKIGFAPANRYGVQYLREGEIHCRSCLSGAKPDSQKFICTQLRHFRKCGCWRLSHFCEPISKEISPSFNGSSDTTESAHKTRFFSCFNTCFEDVRADGPRNNSAV